MVQPNQEMFIGEFQNELRVGHLNESLTQKPIASMVEIMAHAKYYIKGVEIIKEKKARDAKEK